MNDLDGTDALLAALFRQVEVDSTSATPADREDVQRWLREGSPRWRDDLLGLEGRLERHIRQRLSARQPHTREEETPQLRFSFGST